MNSGYVRPSSPIYYRIDNGLYLIATPDGGLNISRAIDIQRRDPKALSAQYLLNDLPINTKLRVSHSHSGITYILFNGPYAVFRAKYLYDSDELVNVRTVTPFRNRGYARSMLNLILRVDGPTHINVMPDKDSPVGIVKLIKFYSSFSGYHAVPGTNKVIRLMTEAIAHIEEAALGARSSQNITEPELAILIQNTKEYKRLLAILQPINQEEVEGLLKAQKTDLLSLQTAMTIYTKEWFDNQPWAREHRVMFAQGMADMLLKYTKRRFGVWDEIVANESI